MTLDDDLVASLRCRSDGNPTAQYSWIEWTSRRRTHGRVYRVDLDDDGPNDDVQSAVLTLQCYASNVIGERSFVVASGNVTLNLTAAVAESRYRTYNSHCLTCVQ